MCAGDDREAKYEEEGPRGEKERERKIEERNKEGAHEREFTGDERKKGLEEITGKKDMKGTSSESRKGMRGEGRRTEQKESKWQGEEWLRWCGEGDSWKKFRGECEEETEGSKDGYERQIDGERVRARKGRK